MPRIVDIDSCLQTVKLIAAAGEIAPFPFIKGVALCAVVILENIQKAENNRSDMQELAKSIVSTLVAVRDIVIEHGPTSASHFQNICVEFQDYMTELLSKLDNERRSRGIRRILKAKKISDDISAYRQRVQAIKEDFLIRTTTMARLVLSDFQDQVNTRLGALAGAMEATERNVTSVIKDNIKEARTSGDLQSEKLQMTLCDFRQRGLYKGVVRDLIPGDIYLKASIPRICHNGSRSDFDEYHAVINDRPKIVRVFRAQADQQERVMQRFQKEVDRRLHLRHPNISQLFGVCTSPNFLALIMHSANVERHLYEVLSNESSVKGVLLFFLRMYNDLQSIANYLAEQAWIQQQEQDDSDGKTLHAQTGCFDEQGRVILNDLSLGYHPFIPFELHLGRSGVSVDANMNLYNHATRRYGVVELERLFQHSAKLERTDLRHFYESVYFLLGYNTWCCYSYPERCYNYPGYAGTGRVVTDLEEWTLHWTVKSGRQGLRRLRSVVNRSYSMIFSLVSTY
ncbi:hypothetical protein EDD85DRAFT_949250 [Armillaria nabsnona]|nr:hypothetical protein EDD85DRAFT_949250 [Armillaria nabsnona]